MIGSDCHYLRCSFDVEGFVFNHQDFEALNLLHCAASNALEVAREAGGGVECRLSACPLGAVFDFRRDALQSAYANPSAFDLITL
jgi:hypothetical protein